MIYLFDSCTYQTKLVKLTNYELLAAMMACYETGMTLAQLVHTPQTWRSSPLRPYEP